ncbi:YncE family protein [Granulicella sp. S156]|uniref:YncE family protein n=1 Tax=Granulicella sp. S156 TaxID=1747224 RepID=UPI00131BC0E7|nr:YncE family protein [Granulicella sp. S156]
MQQAAAKGRRHSLAILTTGLAAVLFTSGCGNQYRPVVTATNPVGPAGQPTKYAVAISNPGTGLTGLITIVDVSGDTVLSTPNIGPASNNNFILPPTSRTCPVNPNIFSIDIATGSTGFIVNPNSASCTTSSTSGGGFADFPLSLPTSLLSQDVVQSTLATGANPTSVEAITVISTGSTVFVTQAGDSSLSPAVPASIAALNVTSGPSLLQSITFADPTQVPAFVVGYDGTQRVYALSEPSAGGLGEASAIEGTQLAISATIPVGINPVYGVMTSDAKRAYILNQGSGTVSVINVVNNALDTGVQYPQQPDGTTPPVGTIPLPNITTPSGTTAPNPVWADYTLTTNELVVLNQGDGVNPGSLSLINIPLCNINTQPANPNCSTTNPTDATGFGTIVATIPVGINPTMVSMLVDGTQAYVVNSGTTGTGAGASVSVVNLSNYQVTTIPYGADVPDTTGSVANTVFGHPNTVSATTGSPTGKVYITSPDDRYLTILRTDNNTVQAHINLQGTGVRVLVNER